jgi:Sigma-70, region 4
MEGARAPASRRRAERRERRLRRSVVRLSGCLDDLSAAQRRVLVLRAGVGEASPRTRQGVARALDIRVQRVRRIERRGLRRARELDRADACGAAVAGGAAPVISTGSLAGTSGGGGTAPGDESLGGGTPGNDRGGSPPADRDSGDVRGESATQPPDLGGPREQAEGTSLWVALGLMLLAALAGFATPALRDRMRSGGTASRAG